MGMDINKHFQFLFLFLHFGIEMFIAERPYQLNLGQPGFGFRVSFSKEASIHIFTLSVAPIVACNDTIWIDHWQDPELETLPKLVS